MEIRRGIIPAAGLGTRLRPLTEKLPKELFPLGRKLVIDYALEEAVWSGIEEVCVVISPQKRQVRERYTKERHRLLKELGQIINFVDISFVEQKQPLGLGDAIWTARDFVGNHPFAVLLPDNVFLAEMAPIGQLIQLFSEHVTCCVGVMAVPESQTIFFASAPKLVFEELRPGVYRIGEILDDAPGPVGEHEIRGIGRYILTSRFFDYYPKAGDKTGKELRETDVLKEYLRAENELYGLLIQGERFDTGSMEGYSRAFMEFIDREL